MSITFNPEQRDSDYAGWAIVCSCGENRTSVLSTDREQAVRLLRTRTPACADEWCDGELGLVVPVAYEEAPMVNISSRNARFVLGELGLIDEYGELCGAASGEEFLGRVLLALAVAPLDEGVPAYGAGGEDGGIRMIEGARRPGYLQDILGLLHQVAEWAIAHDRKVVWA